MEGLEAHPPPRFGAWASNRARRRTSGMLAPASAVKGRRRPRLGTLAPASPAAPPPKAHLTAAPVRRKRWMARSAAVIAA